VEGQESISFLEPWSMGVIRFIIWGKDSGRAKARKENNDVLSESLGIGS
jgi:hypothetical protein